MESLVREAWDHNPDLYTAAAVFEEASAAIRVAASILYPQLNGAGTARYTDHPAGDTREFGAGAQVGWEIDLWGRLRADRNAARLIAESRGLEYLQARHSLAAAVAEAYYAVITAEGQLQIDRLQLASERNTTETTMERVDVGLGAALEENLAKADVLLSEAKVESDLAALREAKRALEILLGRYPAAQEGQAGVLPNPPGGGVIVGVPSSLLERRPDVRSAAVLVDAAFEEVRSARAARLPGLTLSADARTLINPSDFVTTVAGDMLAPVFQGDRLKAEEAIASARQRQALGQYASVALGAFREVEDALSNGRFLARQRTDLEAASGRLRAASSDAVGRYEQGIMTILELQQIRTLDFQTRSQLLGVRYEQLRQRLILYRALGGTVLAEDDPKWQTALAEEMNRRFTGDPAAAPISEKRSSKIGEQKSRVSRRE